PKDVRAVADHRGPAPSGLDELGAGDSDRASVGVDDVLVDDVRGRAEVRQPDLPSEMVAAAVGPVEPGLLVLENVSGHLRVVVAAERDLGDVASNGVRAEEAAVAFGDGAATDHLHVAIRIDAEHDGLAV